MAMVTIQQAKDHLRITDDASNADLGMKVDQASAIVMNHLKSQAVAGWDDGSVVVPGRVEAAVLLIVEYLYEHQPIDWNVINGLLVSYRDPALA
jgi:hypothetical protein